MCTSADPLSVELPRSVEAPGLARGLVTRHLCAEHGRTVVPAAQLLATELTTCAVLYGSPPVNLEIECTGDRVRISVTHATTAQDVRRVPVDEDGGLRSALLDELARSWGVEPTPDGRRLWCVLPTGVPPAWSLPAQRTRPGAARTRE